MKQRLSILVLTLLASLLYHAPLVAQTDELSLRPIMVDAGNYITRIEKNQYKISKMEINLVFKDSRFTYVKLVGGRKYQMLAVGERNRVANLSMKILDKDNRILQDFSNSNNSNQIEAEFTPPTTGFYTFDFKVSEFFSTYTAARYLLIISFR